jgi:hypothetical protein
MTPPRARRAAPALALALSLLCLCLHSQLTAVAGQEQEGDDSGSSLGIKVLDKPTEATSGVPLLVTARVSGGGGGGLRLMNRNGNNGGGALDVQLHYRAMFGEEKTVAMTPQAARPFAGLLGGRGSTAPRDVYAASIPAGDLPGYGQMVRYWVTARSTSASSDGAQLYGRKPRRQEDAYGAVVGAALQQTIKVVLSPPTTQKQQRVFQFSSFQFSEVRTRARC